MIDYTKRSSLLGRRSILWGFLLAIIVIALGFLGFTLASETGTYPLKSDFEQLGIKYPIPPEGSYEGERVEQPIEFPHDIHTAKNNINCLYCHTYGRRSKVAGIPPTSKCMGCHKVIATDKPRIKKLTEYWENRKPIPWKKVHDVPDFVHFTHEKHLQRFIFDNPEVRKNLSVDTVAPICAMCHGDYRRVTVARKMKPLTMGWCVRCHIKNDGPADCWKCHK